MHAHIIATATQISPFGDPVSELGIAGVSLRSWQTELFKKFGLEVSVVDSVSQVDTSSATIVCFDYVFFTRRVLKSFLRQVKGRGSPAQLGLPADSLYIESFTQLHSLREEAGLSCFHFFYFEAGAQLQECPENGISCQKNEVEPLAVVFKEKVIEVPLPARVTGVESWRHPVTSSCVLHIQHWIHLLQANRLAIQVRWIDHVISHPLWSAVLLARAAIPWPGNGSFRWRLLGLANVIGKGADIHPTARVEGCIIGPGAKIGAQALVRASVIGEGAVVEDRACVSYSVIGPRSFVSKYTLVYTSAGLEEANLGMSMQMCMVGRRAALTPRATPIDVIPGGDIRVLHQGKYVKADLAVLGSCFGHDTFLGADVYVAPGREIPNGLTIGPHPARVLAAIPEGLEPGQNYVVREGRLTPR